MALMKMVYMTVSGLPREKGGLRATDSTTAKVEVARIRYPAADEGTSNVGAGVDQSYQPAVANLVW